MDQLDLLHHAQWFKSLEPSEAFRRIAFLGGCSYAELYLVGLRNRDYNFLLSDFSYLQYHHLSLGEGFEVRYALYPNPYEVVSYADFCDDYDLNPFGTDSYEDYLHHISELDECFRVPPFRYEVSFRQYEELVHPTSHLHIGMHKDNRFPLRRVLTPHAFTLLMTKLFYSTAWEQAGKPDKEGELNSLDGLYFKEKAGCAVLDPRYFSEKERQQLFID